MKNFRVLVLSALITLSASAKAEEHQVTVLSNYNYQSGESVGFSAGYQYFFQPNFAVQFGIDQSGELTKRTNSEELVGELDSLYFGASVKKPFNNSISSFASAGLMYVNESSNENLITSASTMPYLGLGFDLAITDNLAFTFKHQSQFSDQAYQDMHHLSFGLSYSFGTKHNDKIVRSKSIDRPNERSKTNPVVAVETPVVTPPSDSKSVSANSLPPITASDDFKRWAIQVGAFKNENNAHAFLLAFNKRTAQQYKDSADISFFDDMYRIIVRRFESKELAKSWQASVLVTQQIESYVLQVANED
ncbi:SPOR domain-containing protein [Thalassotalea eurytherma]|uniref:SPOR domain-containing protein n=1 Tax=Thalassotalea eurytherma TaxID=1144278 RepID=A0ABQ6H0J9_9GAMM|nr:outer membrane beta-barrel protein [Thalassotalea eurytherma]GLX80570.1 hypothetical protein theurythT_00220 [Thalassotalea eurytherma]